MALETLKDVKEIGGFEVKLVTWDQPKDNFIEINHEHNAITFKIQDGPIKEKGLNGCQIDTLIEAAKIMLYGLNKQFPCEENQKAEEHLHIALLYLYDRRKDREKRGVEGESKA